MATGPPARVSALGYRLGVSGALLGIVAGLIQWAIGDDIPDWTGNKLHPVRLGLVTIALSVMALGCVGFLAAIAAPRRGR